MPPRVRILLITDWNRGQGGAEAYITWLRSGLARAGDEVRLLTSSAGTAAEGSADYIAFGTNRLLGQAFLQMANPFAVATLRRALREFTPDVVLVNMFAHHLSPAVLLALSGWTVILLVTDYKCICPIGSKLLPNESICEVRAGWVCHRNGCVSLAHFMRDRPRYALLRAGLKKVSRVIACSEWVKRALAADGIESEFLALPVPAPSPSFRRVAAPHPTFVFCGRLDVEKGVPLLLRAFARILPNVPGAKLRIVGRGPLLPALERFADELGIAANLTFTGWLDPPQLEEQFVDAWALVVPSLWAEPFGLIAVEAVVHGVPVIASRSGGLGEIVELGHSGLLFPNGDEEALARCMLEVAERRAFPEHVIAPDVVGRAAQRCAIDRHIEELHRVFESARIGAPACSDGTTEGRSP
jgi:glycosyltransferase involved in cell wall biosynthesis